VPPVGFTVRAIEESGAETVLAERLLDPDRRVRDRGWVEADVGLERFAEQPIRLRFTAAPGASVPWWGDPTIVVPPPGLRPRQRNVLLVSLDTLRADRLGAYGYRRPTSPRLDAFAAEGTLFERAYSAYPRTDGSHGTMLTGLAPCVHGATQMNWAPLRGDAVTLAEHIRAAGWETGAVTEDGLVTARSGFARGFGTWIEHTFDRERSDAAVTFADGLAWIREHRARPWFLFLHTYQTHDPYRPPPGYLDRVAGQGGRDPLDSALYDAEIRYVDDRFGELLDGLAGLGESEETIVIVVSDHGEHFGEHGMFGHTVSLYDVLLHVPFIVRSPGQVPAATRVADAVGLVDLVPTVLELLDLPAPRWTHGRSLVAAFRGGTLGAGFLFAEGVGDYMAARQGRYKWFVHRLSGEARYVDLVTDPKEDVMIPVDNKNVLAKHQEQCAAPPAPVLDDVTIPVDPAVEKKLRALGYVE
jgi:arylsulfatase A-like enzyme